MPSFVQAASAATTANATTVTASFPANTTPGNTLIALMGTGSASATLTPDSADSSLWTSPNGVQLANTRNEMWYASGIAGGKTGYVFTRSTSGQIDVVLLEISGLVTSNPTDGTAGVNSSTTATTLTAPNITTTNPSDILIAGFFASDNVQAQDPGTWSGLTAGWTIPTNGQTRSTGTGTATNESVALAYQIVSSAGTYTGPSATISVTPAGGDAYILALQGAASADPFPAYLNVAAQAQWSLVRA